MTGWQQYLVVRFKLFCIQGSFGSGMRIPHKKSGRFQVMVSILKTSFNPVLVIANRNRGLPIICKESEEWLAFLIPPALSKEIAQKLLAQFIVIYNLSWFFLRTQMNWSNNRRNQIICLRFSVLFSLGFICVLWWYQWFYDSHVIYKNLSTY